MIAIAAGGGPDSLKVSSGVRLRLGDRAIQFARSHARKPAMPLLGAAIRKDVMSHDALVAEAKVDAAPSEFLDDDGLMSERSAAAAIFLGHARKQQADPARFDPGFGVWVSLRGPPRMMGCKLGFDELTGSLPKHPRFVSHPRRFF